MNTRSATAWKDYCGRERAALRKRRTKTKCNDFSILSQIGQGGYGQVFLARKKDTHEVVALKKMNVTLTLTTPAFLFLLPVFRFTFGDS